MLNTVSRRLMYAGVELHLGPIEFRYIQLLLERPGHTINYERLKAALSGEKRTDNAVRVNMARLRRILRNAGPDPIETVQRVGYRLRAG